MKKSVSEPAPTKRELILSTATRLFARHGFQGTSVQLIAESVNIRKQSVLYYFPSKEVLRLAVIESIFSYWKDVLPMTLISTKGAENRLEAAINVLIEFFEKDHYKAAFLIREVLDRPKEMVELIKRHLWPWRKLITDYIKIGQETGDVRDGVDAEIYLVNIAILVVNIIAIAEPMQRLFEGPNTKSTLERMVKEFMRTAKIALFAN